MRYIAFPSDPDDDDYDDEEVSELTRTGVVALTAESVQQFMKKVNRIRFNSLTAGNNINKKPKFGARSRSCPHLPKIESPESDGDDTDISRSASATLKSVGSCQDTTVDNDNTDGIVPAFTFQKTIECSISKVGNSVGCRSENTAKTNRSDLLHVTKEKSPTCPALSAQSRHEASPWEDNVVPNSYIELMRTLLQPASVFCQNCCRAKADGSQLTPSGNNSSRFI